MMLRPSKSFIQSDKGKGAGIAAGDSSSFNVVKERTAIWCGVLMGFAALVLFDCWWNQRIWSLQLGLRASLSKATVEKATRMEKRSATPHGQQLLLDLVDCSSAILSNEKILVQVALQVAREFEVHEPKVHVATLEPDGIGLVANFGDSHLTLHTWPESQTALINVFIADENNEENLRQDVLSLVAGLLDGDIKKSTFSVIPRGEDVDTSANAAYSPAEIMTRHQFKVLVSEVQSPFQNVAIWDHHDTMDDDTSKDTTRSLFLDGVMQSSIADEFLYHETLVQPAFIASAVPPKRVLIVGGGEGGTLRETLKWKSVEEAVMVDLDAQVIRSSRNFLYSYNNCTGWGTPNCFVDPRVSLYTTDFFKWFDENVGEDICATRSNKKKDMLFDIIILDLLDTEELPEGQAWAEYLYSKLFFERIACATTDLGVVISNFGESPESPFEPDLPWEFYPNVDNSTDDELSRLAMFTKKIDQLRSFSRQFKDFRVFDSYIPAFRANWAFGIGIVPQFSTAEGELTKQGITFFDGTPSQVHYKLRQGIITPKSKNPEDNIVMKYYDGNKQHLLQHSSGDWEGVFCSHVANNKFCNLSERFFDNESDLWKVQEGSVIALTNLVKGDILGAWDNVFPGKETILSSITTSCNPNTAILVEAEPWLDESSWNPALVKVKSEVSSSIVLLRDVKSGETLTLKGVDCQ